MSRARSSPLLPLFVTVLLDQVGVGIIIPVITPLFLLADSPLANPAWGFAFRAILIGLLTACYPLAQFFGAPFLGALSDRWGRKPVLLFSLAGTFIGYIFFALAIKWHVLWLLFLSRTLDGFTGGNISTAQSAASDMSENETERSRNFGLIGAAFGAGLILGPYLGGKLADSAIVPWFGPATPFWFAAGLVLMSITLVSLHFRETLRSPLRRPMKLTAGINNLRRAFAVGNLRTMFLVVFLFMFGFNFFIQFFQVILVQRFGYTGSAIGDMYAYVGVCFALTQAVILQVAARRWPVGKLLSFALLLLAITLAAVIIPRQSWVLYTIAPFMALAMGMAQPNSTAIISGLADSRSQGEVLGINQSITAIAIAVPPIVSGFVASRWLYLPIALSSFFVLCSWIVFMFVFRRQHASLFHEA